MATMFMEVLDIVALTAVAGAAAAVLPTMIGWISHVITKSHPIGPDGKRVTTNNTTSGVRRALWTHAVTTTTTTMELGEL